MQIAKVILWTVALIAVLSPITGTAQESVGSSIVQTALELASQNCDDLSRNQTCYGHVLLSATPRSDTIPLTFNNQGDIEDLAKIQSLRLNGMDLEAGTWGVALMQLRASLPASQAENVTVIAFGDVELENAVQPPTEANIQVNTNQALNIRQFPSTQAGVIGTLTPDQVATAVEQSSDSAWLRVLLPDSEETGWVSADLVTSSDNLNDLNITLQNTTYYREPMQAFYFSSGADDSDFSELPRNGLLIQTPEGVGEVQLLINEINIQLGSTVFFQAQPGNMMTVSTLEGHADIRAFGIEQTAYPGTQVTIPLADNLTPSGPPSPPQPYDKSQMDTLPTPLLTRSIVAAEPMSYVAIQERLAESSGINNEVNATADGGTASNTDNTIDICCGPENAPGQDDSCPGNSCNAPGQGGSCPGNSCNAPGQGGSCPGNSCNAPGRGRNN